MSSRTVLVPFTGAILLLLYRSLAFLLVYVFLHSHLLYLVFLPFSFLCILFCAFLLFLTFSVFFAVCFFLFFSLTTLALDIFPLPLFFCRSLCFSHFVSILFYSTSHFIRFFFHFFMFLFAFSCFLLFLNIPYFFVVLSCFLLLSYILYDFFLLYFVSFLFSLTLSFFFAIFFNFSRFYLISLSFLLFFALVWFLHTKWIIPADAIAGKSVRKELTITISFLHAHNAWSINTDSEPKYIAFSEVQKCFLAFYGKKQ